MSTEMKNEAAVIAKDGGPQQVINFTVHLGEANAKTQGVVIGNNNRMSISGTDQQATPATDADPDLAVDGDGGEWQTRCGSCDSDDVQVHTRQ